RVLRPAPWFHAVMCAPTPDRMKDSEATVTADQVDVEQLKLLFDTWPHAAFALDAQGVFIYQNTPDRAAFGNLIGKTAADIDDEKAKAESWDDIHRKVLSGETVAMIVTDEEGTPTSRDAEVILSPLGSASSPCGILGMTINRSDDWRLQRERMSAARAAEESRARLKRLTDNVPGGIFEFAINAEGGARFDYVNSGMGPLLGTTTEALLSDAGQAFVFDHPEDADDVTDAIQRSFETLEPVRITHRVNHPTLGLRWNRVQGSPTRLPDGGVVWHGCIFDVTEERARAEELEKARNRMAALVLVDTLTGLPNRRACDEEYLRRRGDPAARRQTSTVIRIDLDHFKAVNDTLGHEAGDAVLCRVGECLEEVTTDDDFAGRLGGDEFVILLAPGKTLDNAKDVIARLRDALAVPFTHDGRHCRFDASFGASSTVKLPDDLAAMLSSADAALLRAKAKGRGRMEVFTPELQRQIEHTRKRAAEIKLGLERSEFVPFFQPQINASTGALSGFEVLARWEHPSEGCLTPDEFISVSEQMRVVQDLDRMMFDKAIGALDRLHADGFSIPKLAFNVSAARVHDHDIIESIKTLQTKGTQVAFELLESILLEDETALFAHHIDLLKDLGVEIEVDDFGSGHASIIGVLKVTPNTLKLDRRLVIPMFESQSAQNLLRAMIDIGRSLNVSVTAEGVETMEHAMALRELGCQTLQGFGFGRPMPEAALRGFLTSFVPAFPEASAAV
ncbi:MAG: EAL domain-containing protein, partial [Pseudomonadota bacterium]